MSFELATSLCNCVGSDTLIDKLRNMLGSKANDNNLTRLRAILRAYPNNRVVMRPSEKFEAKAAGQKCSEAWFSPR